MSAPTAPIEAPREIGQHPAPPRMWHVPATEVQAARAWAGQPWTAMCGTRIGAAHPHRIAAAGAPAAHLSCVVCLDLRDQMPERGAA